MLGLVVLFFGEVQEYAAVVSEEHGLEVACVHEHFSGVEFSGLFQAVAGFGVQAGEFEASGFSFGFVAYLDVGYEGAGLVFVCYLPAVVEVVFAVGGDAVVVSFADEVVVFVVIPVECNGFCFFFFGQFCDVEFIAEGSGEGCVGTGFHGGYAAYGVVGADADVGAHGA